MNDALLVVSDIHGALSGAEMVLKARKHHDVKEILCLGDVLYHGPRNDLPRDYAPKQVIEIMNSLKDCITAVRGNCEAEVDQMVLSFPVMADYNSLFFHDRRIFMSHGHVYGPNHLPDLPFGTMFLSGHTHIPTAYEKDGLLLCNPGSVSLPKNSHPCTYGLIDETGFTVYTFDHQVYMQAGWLNQ